MNLIKNKGFTIIEAIVSLALFAIAFSGLYFFFGMAHQAYNNSEKRMHLNLMANHILDTIHAEAYRSDTDVANPFVTPASYNANLSDCSTYTAPDVRHTWCTELDASVGPHKGVHADEVRTVEVVKDEAYLIADVTLVIDAGIGEKNLIKTFLSRKIAAPRRSKSISDNCLERHNTFVAYIKSEKAKCDAGSVPFISNGGWSPRDRYGPSWRPSWGDKRAEERIRCPDYTIIEAGIHDHYLRPPYDDALGYSRSFLANNVYQNWLYDKVYSLATPNTIYGEGYLHKLTFPLSSIAGPGFIRAQGARNLPLVDRTNSLCTNKASDKFAYYPKVVCTRENTSVTVISCCPGDEDKKGDGTYKSCNAEKTIDPGLYVPFMMETIDWGYFR